jgi:hypothetical protein
MGQLPVVWQPLNKAAARVAAAKVLIKKVVFLIDLNMDGL